MLIFVHKGEIFPVWARAEIGIICTAREVPIQLCILDTIQTRKIRKRTVTPFPRENKYV